MPDHPRSGDKTPTNPRRCYNGTEKYCDRKEARLRKVSRPVEKFDERLWTLLDDMADTMYEADGVGHCRGTGRRCCAGSLWWMWARASSELVNPTIIRPKRRGRTASEGCLSSPGEYGLVVRPAEGGPSRPTTGTASPLRWRPDATLLARAICHENDHLDGQMFKEHCPPTMLTDEELRELDEAVRTMRIVFMGTPDFAVPSPAKAPRRTGTRCPAVFTQPDKPVGRHAVLTPPPVKAAGAGAGHPGVPAHQNAGRHRGRPAAGAGSGSAWWWWPTGAFCRKAILDDAAQGLHQCSRLPAAQIPGRRTHPVERSSTGRPITGVTSMFMDAGMDTGDII